MYFVINNLGMILYFCISIDNVTCNISDILELEHGVKFVSG